MRTILRLSVPRFAVALALAVVAAACSAQKAGGKGDLPPSPSDVTVRIDPEGGTTLYPTQSFGFTAIVTGTASQLVDWSVTGGDANGTITGDGNYTAPSGTGVFEVKATSRATPTAFATATVNVIAAPPDGIPMTTAHRTSGVAPLAVFFDAVNDVAAGASVNGSTFAWSSGVFQPSDYEGTLYSWDFGDPGSGAWTTTSKSRNTATGYTAAHVYETPGTYKATLVITDATGTVRTYSQTITVSPFSGTTFYVAASGVDTNAGTSTSAPFRTVAKAMTTALAASGPVRILFNRGDTFTVTTSYAISKAGPGIIGAYGTGNRPVLNCPDLGDTNIFSARGAGQDWRIMDLEFHGPSTSTDTGPVGPPVTAQAVNQLFLRLRCTNWKVGLGWGDWTPIFATPHDGMFVVDCEIPNAGNYAMYLGGRRLALLGISATDSGTTHVTRVWQAHKAVISNNAFLRPGGQRHALKLHGPSVNGPDSNGGARQACPATRWVSISDNLMASSNTSQWTVSVGPQDSINDERISHVVYERNKHTGTPSLVADIEGSASSVMVRNNVFDGTNADSYTGILYMHRGIEPIPDDLRFYGNTFYKGGSNSGTIGFDIEAGVTNCRIRNNLLAYGSGSATMISGGGGTGWAQDHNLLTTTPGFTSASTGDFSLASGPAIDAGATLTELREDYLRAPRPAGAGYDIGAYESH